VGASGIELSLAYRPEASIVIVTARDGAVIRSCLKHLAELAPGVPFETIVVLNGGPTHDAEAIRGDTTGVEVVASEVDLGYGAALNAARPHSHGEYLVLLHDRARPEPGWLESLVAAADAEPDAGAIGSLVLDQDGSVQAAGGVLRGDGATADAWNGDPPPRSTFQPRAAVDYSSACSLLVRTVAWDLVGGADERYFPLAYTDVDLCFALRAHGMRVLCEPASVVEYRPGSAETGEFAAFVCERDRTQFLRKWAPLLERQAAGSGATFDLPASAIPAQDREHDPGNRARRQVALAAEVANAFAQHVDRQRAAALAERDRAEQALASVREELEQAKRRLAEIEAELPFLRTRADQMAQVEAGRWWRLRGRIEPALQAATAARRKSERQ
jgi:GT2 family glycosyltransferase